MSLLSSTTLSFHLTPSSPSNSDKISAFYNLLVHVFFCFFSLAILSVISCKFLLSSATFAFTLSNFATTLSLAASFYFYSFASFETLSLRGLTFFQTSVNFFMATTQSNMKRQFESDFLIISLFQ